MMQQDRNENEGTYLQWPAPSSQADTTGVTQPAELSLRHSACSYRGPSNKLSELISLLSKYVHTPGPGRASWCWITVKDWHTLRGFSHEHIIWNWANSSLKCIDFISLLSSYVYRLYSLRARCHNFLSERFALKFPVNIIWFWFEALTAVCLLPSRDIKPDNILLDEHGKLPPLLPFFSRLLVFELKVKLRLKFD